MSSILKSAVDELIIPGKSSKKAILTVLANLADEDGLCIVSNNDLANKSGLHRVTSVRIMNALANDGYLSRTHGFNDNGTRAPNAIQLNSSKILALAGSGPHSFHPDKIVEAPMTDEGSSRSSASIVAEVADNELGSSSSPSSEVAEDRGDLFDLFVTAYHGLKDPIKKYAASIPVVAAYMKN